MRIGKIKMAAKAAILLIALLIWAAAAGCVNLPGGVGSKLSDDIKDVIMAGNGERAALETKPKSYAGRGEPQPVDPASLTVQAPDSHQFDPATAGDNDLVTVDMIYNVKVSGGNSGSLKRMLGAGGPGAVVTTLIPKTIEHKQLVLGMDFSRDPTRIYDVGDNRYAEFTVEDPQEDFDIRILVTLKLFRYDLSTARDSGLAAPLSEAERAAYTKEERFIEKDHPSIREAAERINGIDDVDTVKKIHDFVAENLSYDKSKAEKAMAKTYGAARALEIKSGVCVEYADLFIALCRAKGIPAKYVGGIPTEGESLGKGHAWAEVYLANHGWVPSDPTWGDTGAVTFEKLRPSYIYLTDVRHDEVINQSDIFTCRYVGLEVDVEHSLAIDSARTKYIAQVREEVDRGKGELDQLSKGIDSSAAAVVASQADLDRLNRQITDARRNLDIRTFSSRADYERSVQAHNSLVVLYNEKIVAHNAKVASHQAEVNRYEAKRAEVNASVSNYNDIK
ncbi:MAG: transglutaminase domain-containing protein [Actinobacteria bacterium]|nr:transglutaminase domain-containing protein [Actinomycetota bacterium]